MSKLEIFLLGFLAGETLMIVADQIMKIRDEILIKKTMKEVLKEKEEEVEIL